MNIYDCANELASALKASPEVVEYKKLSENVNKSETNKKMIDDIRKKQFEIYSMQAQGIEPSKEKIEEFQKLWNVVSLNSEVKEFFDAEIKFSQIMNDIGKIISDAVGIDLNNK